MVKSKKSSYQQIHVSIFVGESGTGGTEVGRKWGQPNFMSANQISK